MKEKNNQLPDQASEPIAPIEPAENSRTEATKTSPEDTPEQLSDTEKACAAEPPKAEQELPSEHAETEQPLPDTISESELPLTAKPDENAEAAIEETPASPSKAEKSAAPEDKQETYAFRWDYTEQNLYDKRKKPGVDTKGLRNFALIMSIAFVLSLLAMFSVLCINLPRRGSGGNGVSLDALYDECYPSYVAINAVSATGASGVGSGIIMTTDGFIATNYHVVEDAESISVILHDGTSVEAEYIDGDDLNDIAILKIDKRGLTKAVIGSSDNVRVGEQVMAIGTPYSIQYRGTMTSGYISALNRKYAAKNDNGTVKKVITLLQTDTSVNPGNSGGPLFNMDGEVIGIVSMKIAGSEYEGMGFAIPIDGVIDMLWDIVDHGKLTISNGGSAFEGAALGITGQTVIKNTTYLYSGDYIFETDLDEKGERRVIYETVYGAKIPIPLSDTYLLEEYGITEYTLYTAPETGCRVLGINEKFDSAKHLQIDDIIVKANGTRCNYMEILQELVANSRVGDKLELEVWRNGETLWLTVELGRSATMESEE